jgi:hypothetical protein
MNKCTRSEALEAENTKIMVLRDVAPCSLVYKHQILCIWKQHALVSMHQNTRRHILEDCNLNTCIKYIAGLQRNLPFFVQLLYN